MFSAYLVLNYLKEDRNLIDNALSSARQVSEESVSQINNSLNRVASQVDETAQKLFRGGVPSEFLIRALTRRLVYSDPNILQAGVAFAPFAYNSRTRLFGLANTIEEGAVKVVDLDASEDYSMAGSEWFNLPMQGSSVWLPPQFYSDKSNATVTYSAPLYGNDNSTEPIGVVFATYELTAFQSLMDTMDLGRYGYSFLLSSENRFMLHQNKNLIGKQLMFNRRSGQTPDAVETRQIKQALDDSSLTVNFSDPDTGLQTRIFFLPIPSANWNMGLVLADGDGNLPVKISHRKLTNIALALLVSTFFLTAAIAKANQDRRRGLWIVSSVFAGSCILVGIFVMTLVMKSKIPDREGVLPITNWNTLNQFISEQRLRTLTEREEIPYFIPTGVYIQSVYLEDATTVGISGYVWQRYTKGIHDNIKRGFIMPLAKGINVTKSYTATDKKSEVVRWNFNATIHQNFNYSKYPFDSERIIVDLWHKEFTKNVILIPDLISYDLINPAARPGLSKDIKISGWKIGDSSFYYLNETFETSFGLSDFSGLRNFPNLYFGVDIRKEITGPFVSNMLPLMVVTILLFTILFLGTQDAKKTGQLGIALDVIAACAGFFLVAILLHIAIRRDLAAREIFYLEYFYFVTYSMILYVAVNYVLLSKTAFHFIHRNDNFIAKVAFWPISQFALLWFTLTKFYA
jgi:hypothetical protein